MSNEYVGQDGAGQGATPYATPPAYATQQFQQVQHNIPMCQRCGAITPWKTGPLLRPINWIIGLIFLLAWGGGLVYLAIVALIRANPNNREKICPRCGANNLWTFIYPDGAVPNQPVSAPAQPVVQPGATGTQMAQGYTPPYGNFSATGAQTYPAMSQTTSIGTNILWLGIFSLFCFPFVLGPIAWIKGNKALADIDAGQGNAFDRPNVVTGRICGIIGSAIGALAVILWLHGHM